MFLREEPIDTALPRGSDKNKEWNQREEQKGHETCRAELMKETPPAQCCQRARF